MKKEHITQINGAKLSYTVQGAGLPCVLCHGGPGGYDYLGPVAAGEVPGCVHSVRDDSLG